MLALSLPSFGEHSLPLNIPVSIGFLALYIKIT